MSPILMITSAEPGGDGRLRAPDVGESTGITPGTVAQTVDDAVTFFAAMGLQQAHIPGPGPDPEAPVKGLPGLGARGSYSSMTPFAAEPYLSDVS